MTKQFALKQFKDIYSEEVSYYMDMKDQTALNTLWNNFVDTLARSPRNHRVNKNWECPIEVKPNVTKWLEKYPCTLNFEKVHSRTGFVEYLITMTDGNKYFVIMTEAQYNGLRRSKMWEYIYQIEGKGHRKRKENGC